LDQKPNGRTLGVESCLEAGAAFPANRRHLYDAAVFVNGHDRDDTPIGKENRIERTVSIQQNFSQLTGNWFKVRHEASEITRWQRKQEPIAGRIWRIAHSL
jgi:hypothetical protein